MTPTVADQQILVGTAATVTCQFVDQNGEPKNPTGAVSVAAVKADGSTFTIVATPTVTNAVCSVLLPVTAALNVLTLTWSDTVSTVTTVVEIVSRYYASAAQIKNQDRTIAGNETKYTPELIHEKRRVTEYEFERITHRAFVPRFARVRLRACTPGVLDLPHPDVHEGSLSLWAVNLDGSLTAFSSQVILDPTAGQVRGSWYSDVVAEYVHGMVAPPPDLLDAFYLRVRDVMNRPTSGVPDRATTFSSDVGGTYSLLTPGRGGSMTGIGLVDEVLTKYMPLDRIVG